MNAETLWVGVNAIGISLTVWAERAAYADVRAVRSMNGHIIGIQARGNLLRERIRLAIQLVFLGVGINAMATPPVTPWTPPVIALMVVPFLVVVNSLSELRDRQKIGRRSRAEIAAERDRRMDRLEDQGTLLETKLDENTRITQQASDNADRAHVAADAVRDTLTGQGDVLILQGEEAAEDRELGRDTNETAHRIDEKVP